MHRVCGKCNAIVPWKWESSFCSKKCLEKAGGYFGTLSRTIEKDAEWVEAQRAKEAEFWNGRAETTEADRAAWREEYRREAAERDVMDARRWALIRAGEWEPEEGYKGEFAQIMERYLARWLFCSLCSELALYVVWQAEEVAGCCFFVCEEHGAEFGGRNGRELGGGWEIRHLPSLHRIWYGG